RPPLHPTSLPYTTLFRSSGSPSSCPSHYTHSTASSQHTCDGGATPGDCTHQGTLVCSLGSRGCRSGSCLSCHGSSRSSRNPRKHVEKAPDGQYTHAQVCKPTGEQTYSTDQPQRHRAPPHQGAISMESANSITAVAASITPIRNGPIASTAVNRKFCHVLRNSSSLAVRVSKIFADSS